MEHTTSYQSIVLMGKIASGKGTQAEHIQRHFGGYLYSNGDKVRQTAKVDSVFGQKMKEMYEGGLLIPEWIASYWMTHALIHEHADERIVFEAVAKKPHEAELFHEIHTWIGRPYIVFHIDITDEEVRKRSALRNRDVVDTAQSVEKRLQEYEMYTANSIEIFKSKGTLVTINGSQTQTEVTEEIFKHLQAS